MFTGPVLWTEKRPELDRTTTGKDRNSDEPERTATAVRSSVHHDFKKVETDKRPVATGCNRSLVHIILGTVSTIICLDYSFNGIIFTILRVTDFKSEFEIARNRLMYASACLLCLPQS